MKITDLPVELLARILDRVQSPWLDHDTSSNLLNLHFFIDGDYQAFWSRAKLAKLAEDRLIAQLVCKDFQNAIYSCWSYFHSITMFIKSSKSISATRSALAQMSKNNVVCHMKVYGDYPLDNIFVYPLKLSQLMSVVISIDAPIDVTAMMDCLGCVNARSLCFNASHISSCHLVPWHEYTHLKSLQICNTTLTPPRLRRQLCRWVCCIPDWLWKIYNNSPSTSEPTLFFFLLWKDLSRVSAASKYRRAHSQGT